MAVEPVKETTRTRGMSNQGGARPGTVSRHEVEHPGWKACVHERLDEVDRRQGRFLRRLEHDGVAADEGRQDLPGRHRDREVPGGNHAADTDRLPHRHRELVPQLRRRGLAMQPTALAGHQLRHVDRFLHVAGRLGHHLAHFPGHVVREAILALGEELCRAIQNLGTSRGGNESPGPIGLLGGRHRAVDVGGGGLLEVADQVRRVGGAAVLEDLARRRRHPLAVDEVRVCPDAHGAYALVTLVRGMSTGRQRALMCAR